MESPEDREEGQEEAQHVPQMPAGDAVEGGTSLDPNPGGQVEGQPDKISAKDTPPEAQPEEEE